ncbi:(2Fe-2S)-binding protein [Paenibacillus sp. J22TS3]|uniref:(2Fe-2S)-binding protein n=1 Tax=Paenibacillus sp. J22TS3 TaxID=2807192 RepID=UPI001B2265EA|nr:(2Fe-2S)-binding protein [Paenibacillus sp. J22TS3]GIP21846.1 hypothetical protein J22TS3_21210 [Paenibacillus sp. J22TS3]
MKLDADWLEQYVHIVGGEPGGVITRVSASAFLEDDMAVSFLREFQKEITGHDLQVASTYFISSWRALCALQQYIVTLSDTWLDFSLSNIELLLCRKNGYPAIMFKLSEPAEQPWPYPLPHERFREDMITRFYSETLRPLAEVLARVSGLPAAQIWGQLPLGVSYYVNLISGRLEREPDRVRLQEEYERLTGELQPSAFGLSLNPYRIKKKMIDDPYHPGGQMTMKPTCCLAYRTDSGNGYCYSCPKLTRQQREEKAAAIMAASASK